jgi:putative acetyltransferase
MEINFKRVDPSSEEALKFTEKLFEELDSMYEQGESEEFKEENNEFDLFIMAYSDKEEAVACGALRPLDETTAEIKRMFVLKKHRGSGYSKLVLYELEAIAKDKGFKRLVLKTGVMQTEAINLYKQNGFTRAECFGKYVGDPESLCFEKMIE